MITDALRREIRGRISGTVRFDEPLGVYTSIGVGGVADVLALPESCEDLRRLVGFLTDHDVPFFPVGNWTNLVIRDGGYRGVVICLAKIRGMAPREGNGGRWYIVAEAGASLASLLLLAAQRGLPGLEFLAGIPGSVGGAIRMNAGAYGHEIQEIVDSITVMEPSGQQRDCPREALAFCYRSLPLPEGTIILRATFRLQGRGDRGAIAEQIRKIMLERQGKHPLQYKNAGSIFKNPAAGPAGRIIEAAGLKGLRIGGARVSEQHANFIVNTGGATAKDVTNLIEAVQERIWTDMGIRLEPEVVIIGDEA